jgi:hypothetical protein
MTMEASWAFRVVAAEEYSGLSFCRGQTRRQQSSERSVCEATIRRGRKLLRQDMGTPGSMHAAVVVTF